MSTRESACARASLKSIRHFEVGLIFWAGEDMPLLKPEPGRRAKRGAGQKPKQAADLPLSDIDPHFTCQACGSKGADVRPIFHWEKEARRTWNAIRALTVVSKFAMILTAQLGLRPISANLMVDLSSPVECREKSSIDAP